MTQHEQKFSDAKVSIFFIMMQQDKKIVLPIALQTMLRMDFGGNGAPFRHSNMGIPPVFVCRGLSERYVFVL